LIVSADVGGSSRAALARKRHQEMGRLIRVERGSLLRLRGEEGAPQAELPRWVTMQQGDAGGRSSEVRK